MPTEVEKPMRANPVAKIADEIGHFLWAKGYGRNCVNCDHWASAPPDSQESDREFCTMFDMKPPARIIVVGCEKHTDLIPF